MPKNTTLSPFSDKLLAWFDQHGRKSLPWQRNRDPYQVWVSEIMLQQTQVKAVIPYFEPFIASFPTVEALASADSDTVMHHWSGLGYYARARNLHKAAKSIVSDHASKFPQNFDEVVALPGIGKSTAGAILAFCFEQHHAILDGNVKRVLTRYHAIEGYPGKKEVEQPLWQLALELTPKERVGDYTQAIMDLGATLCTRSRPDCPRCPMRNDCEANRTQTQTLYPFRKPRTVRNQKEVKMLILLRPSGEVLLEKRPDSGIWGGLWSLPETENQVNSETQIMEKFGFQVNTARLLAAVQHGFTHFDLVIHPQCLQVTEPTLTLADGDEYLWYDLTNPQAVGLPAIVSKLLAKLSD